MELFPNFAVILAVVLFERYFAVIVNVAWVFPAATTTVVGIEMSDELDESVSFAPPVGATEFNVTVPVPVVDAMRVVGLNDRL